MNIIDAYNAVKEGKQVRVRDIGTLVTLNDLGTMTLPTGVPVAINEHAIQDGCFELVPTKRYRVKTLVELLEVGTAVSRPCRIIPRERGNPPSPEFVFRLMGRNCGAILPEGFRPGDNHEGHAYADWMLEEVEV